MIRGIRPLVKGTHDRQQVEAGALHAVGGGLGAGVAFLGAWYFATPIRTALAPGVLAIVVAVGVLAIGRDLGVLKIDRRQTQVPQCWRRRLGLRRSYFAYGAVLGAGMFTHVPFGVAYVLMAVAALGSSPLTAMAMGAALGAGRTLPVAVSTLLVNGVERVAHTAFINWRQPIRPLSASLTVIIVVITVAV